MKLRVDQPLDLKLNLTMGQAFRWTGPDIDGWFSGVVKGILIKIRRTENGVEFRSSKPEESVRSLLEHYLRLDEGIQSIYNGLSLSDPHMAELVKKYKGMRILRQEPWECLVSYICSNNNSVEGIGRIVENLSHGFGGPLSIDGCERRAFPTADRLAEVGASELKPLVVMRRRAECIHQVATDVAAGRLDLDTLGRVSYGEAKDRLVAYKGIGSKIADCVLLFSLDKPEAFPIDTNIRQGIERFYGDQFFSGTKLPTDRSLLQWAQDRFGSNAGYASQFLFHAVMSEKDKG